MIWVGLAMRILRRGRFCPKGIRFCKREQRYFGVGHRPKEGGRAAQALAAKEESLRRDYGADAISHLKLSATTFYPLYRSGLGRISDLVRVLKEDPSGDSITGLCRQFGPRKLAELREKLIENGHLPG